MSEHDADDGDEVVLLTASDGATYALRRSQLEAFRVTDEQRDALVDASDEDTTGYAFGTTSTLSFGGSVQLLQPVSLPGDRFIPPSLSLGEVAIPGDTL